jgi:hypothetical protein
MNRIPKLASNYFHLLKQEPYTQREAITWLIENASENGIVTHSIRSLAKVWQWNEPGARRFIKKLAAAALIDVTSDALGTTIIICNYDEYITSNKRNETASDAANEASRAKSSETHKDEVEFDVSGEAGLTTINKTLKPNHQAVIDVVNDSGDFLATFQKKEKNQKKENLQKEKNTPYRGLKKEKVTSENADLEHVIRPSKSKNQIGFDEVSTFLVEAWAVTNLSSELNLRWELGKFKDYWRSTHKKPPKDGLAAFRNWLRNAEQYQQQNEGKNGRYHSKQQSSGIENFLAAGASLAAKYSRDRLDGSDVRQEQQLQPSDTGD